MIALLLTLAAGPTATFTADGPFLGVKVSPAGVAKVTVYTGGEAPFADGETEADGTATVPMPKGGEGLVGITIDGKESDLIPLKVEKDEVTPPRVSLTFGTRPCCQGAAREPEAVARPVPWALYAVLGGCVVLLSATVVLVLSGRPAPIRGPTVREGSAPSPP